MNEEQLNALIREKIESGELTLDEKIALNQLLQTREEYKRFNRAEFFSPYPYQEKFFEAGKDFRYRFLSAGNRIGKTYSQAVEVYFHLSGKYPSWWKGRRFERPTIIWAIGINVESTRDVLQKELLGTNNAKDLESIGLGAIPKKYINFSTIERDGGRILRAQIKHHNALGEFDGYSSLAFKTSMMDEAALMGAKLDYVWLDEQPPHNDHEIYAQLVMRTSDSGGSLSITATPEQGATSLLKEFRDNNGDGKYYQQAGWLDAHTSLGGHLDDAKIDLMKKNIPSWQLAMRMNGEPILGSGAVYDVDLKSLICDPFDIPNHWRQVCAIDLGLAHDTAAIWSAYDPYNDTIYITGEHVLANATPIIHAAAINKRETWIPVILPKDAAQREKGTGRDLISYYKEAGVNVEYETFYNAHKNDGSKSNSVETGIFHLRDRMISGRFKIFSTCQQLMKQLETYYREEGNIVKKNDDIADAMRYSAMSVITRGKTKNSVSDDRGYENSWSY